MKSLKFFKLALAATLGIDSWRLVLLLATAVSLIGYPNPARAATFNVTVGAFHPLPWSDNWFVPLSVTIHPGDQVKWTWASSGHSTTSSNGIWDSGIRSQGATFTHTFNSVGTFPYYCRVHGEVGTVIVTSATPTPPPVVATNPATNVANFSATLNGTVNPNGLTTAVHFDYGTTTSYGSSSAIQNYEGNTTQNVTTNLSSLVAGTTYHFRIAASNAAGTSYGTDRTFTTPAVRAVVADFNGDSSPDFVLQIAATHETVIGYLDNLLVIGAAVGPTLPAGWRLVGAADFDGDGNTDYVLFIPATGQTVIAYLSGVTVIDAAFGPTVPLGWDLVRITDFNGDGYPDYVLYNASTGETMIGYLNNTVVVGAVLGPTLPAGWNLIDIADFNNDGQPDYAVLISGTGQTIIGYLSGPTVIGVAFGPTVPVTWPLVATADFDGDGHPDYLLYNAASGQTAVGYLNDTVVVNAALGPILPAGWSLAGQ
jgi:plastocyanin